MPSPHPFGDHWSSPHAASSRNGRSSPYASPRRRRSPANRADSRSAPRNRLPPCILFAPGRARRDSGTPGRKRDRHATRCKQARRLSSFQPAVAASQPTGGRGKPHGSQPAMRRPHNVSGSPRKALRRTDARAPPSQIARCRASVTRTSSKSSTAPTAFGTPHADGTGDASLAIASGTARRKRNVSFRFQRNQRFPASHALPATAGVSKPERRTNPVDQLAATDHVPGQPLQPCEVTPKTADDLILDLHVPHGTESGSPCQHPICGRQAALAHGDETSWRVHIRGEEGENPRSWLWVCQTAVRMALPAAQRRRRSCSEASASTSRYIATGTPLTRSWRRICRTGSCSFTAGRMFAATSWTSGSGAPT